MLKSLGLLIAGLCLFASLARAGTVTVVLSDGGGPYAEFATALAEGLGTTSWSVTATRTAETLSRNESADVIVAAGGEAFRQALRRNPGTPILATLLARQSYEQILRDTPGIPRRTSAIFLDQPPERQAAFVRRLLPGQRQIGTLLGADTRDSAAAYRQAFADAGLPLSSEQVHDDASLLIALNALLPRVGVLLALPDSTIYRRDTIKAILMTAFRYQRPVVGYSAAFAKAGGLAALYSTPTQLARQAAQTVSAHGSNLPPASWPRFFSITINNDVAAALGLSIKDENAILQALQSDKPQDKEAR